MGPRYWKGRSFPYLLLLPVLVVLSAVLLYPLLYCLYLSFHRWDLMKLWAKKSLVGLGNYSWMVHDARFLSSLKITAIYVTAEVAVSFVIGFAIALLFSRKIRGASVWKTLLLIPYLLPGVVCAITFKWLYNAEYGILNYLFMLLHLPPQNWLSNSSTALLGVVLCSSWWAIPFVFLILLAGLESLPREVFEAARIDGASSLSIFKHITLPLVAPVIEVVIAMRLIQAFQMVVNVFILTKGGPGGSTEILNFYLWKVGFKYFWMGKASAIGITMMVAIVLIVMLSFKAIESGLKREGGP